MFSWSPTGSKTERRFRLCSRTIDIRLFDRSSAFRRRKGIVKSRRTESPGYELHVFSLSRLSAEFVPTQPGARARGHAGRTGKLPSCPAYSPKPTFVHVISFLHRGKENTRWHFPALIFFLLKKKDMSVNYRATLSGLDSTRRTHPDDWIMGRPTGFLLVYEWRSSPLPTHLGSFPAGQSEQGVLCPPIRAWMVLET